MASLNTGGGGGGPPYYVQKNKPGDTETGARWYDLDDGIFSLADGSRYSPVTPAYATDEAETFAESGVTLTTTKTLVANGSVELDDYNPTTTASLGSLGSTSSLTGGETAGIEINPNTDLTGVKFRVSSTNSGVDKAQLLDSTQTVIAEKTGVMAGDWVTFKNALTAATTYYVAVYSADGWNPAYQGSSTYPYASTDIDATAGLKWDGTTSTSFRYCVDRVTALDYATSGSVTVDWAGPTDIASWDLATFQRTLAGETVTIDVEDSAGTVLFSDIPQNFDISTVATSTDVRLVANLSRANTANNPTFDYAARRWMR